MKKFEKIYVVYAFTTNINTKSLIGFFAKRINAVEFARQYESDNSYCRCQIEPVFTDLTLIRI